VWLGFGIVCLVLVVQSLALFLLVKQHRAQAQADTEGALLRDAQHERTRVADLEAVLEAVKAGLTLVWDERKQEQARASQYEVGAFFPSDENIAELERQAGRAEDNFIPAGRPPKYSFRRSENLPNRFNRGR
jgi:hypothetical protein